MKQGRNVLAAAVVASVAVAFLGAHVGGSEETVDAAPPRPVLSVALTRAEASVLPIRVPASGNVAAWQEAGVGAEGDGLRLVEVAANVGDAVTRGQLLARFDDAIARAELAEARASVAQVEAEALEADANADRAKRLESSGAMSAQQINQYAVAAKTARARLDVARAIEHKHRLLLGQTRVLAPSDGIVTSRIATVGAVVPAGQELFRMIRDGRLEWLAQVSASDLQRLTVGQVAMVDVRGRPPIRGTLRMVGPMIDTATRSGLVYIDLPRDDALRTGAFVTGHIEVGETPALTLPQGAVLLRDGFHHVMRVGPASRVVLQKVVPGRRVGDRIEITGGLAFADEVIASGQGFLSEGDIVRVVADAPVGSAALSANGP